MNAFVKRHQVKIAGVLTCFDREIAVSLTGIDLPHFESRWDQVGVEMLAEKCQYLIEERGFEPWSP